MFGNIEIKIPLIDDMANCLIRLEGLLQYVAFKFLMDNARDTMERAKYFGASLSGYILFQEGLSLLPLPALKKYLPIYRGLVVFLLFLVVW